MDRDVRLQSKLMHYLPAFLRYAFFGVLTFGLVACNASTNNSSNDESTAITVPESPVLTLKPESTKMIRFNWEAALGGTEYRLLENSDGVSGYTQIATLEAGTTEYDLEVFLPDRINASYILQACNNVGCSDSHTEFVTGTLAEAVGYIKASNTGANDEFGRSIAISADGDTLAVGAPFENSSATHSGAVYIFARTDGIWTQEAYVKASNAGHSDWFGWNIALASDGNTLAVGAPTESSNAIGIDGDQINNDAANSGAVYVFSRNGTTWTQQAYVKASNTGAGDRFGYNVALSEDGNTLAVGAIWESSSTKGIGGDQNNDDAMNSGAVYVFTRSGTTWAQQAYIKASNTKSLDEFGFSVALSSDGNTLAVGAPLESSNATGIGGDQSNDDANGSGAVYVYSRNGTSWTKQAYVKASNTGAGNRFGFSVALSSDGNTLAVGAVYEGSNILFSSDIESGAVYVFSRNSDNWSQQSFVKASNPGPNDWFGSSVALSADGNTLVVGASGEDSNASGINGDESNNSASQSGAAYVFTRSSSVWSQLAYVKASNTSPRDSFGSSVALSYEGNTLAVGAYRENSNAVGINGDQNNIEARNSGAVYLY